MSSYLTWCLRKAVISGNAYAVARHIAKGADVGHVHLGRPMLVWAADRAHGAVMAALLKSKCYRMIETLLDEQRYMYLRLEGMLCRFLYF